MTADVPEFDLNVDTTGRVRFAHPVQARAYLRAKFAGQVIVGQFYEVRAKRSARQNRAFHAMITPWLLCETRGGWSLDALKFWVLGEAFGRIECTDPKTGELFQIPAEMHTSRLSIAQFVHLMDRAMELAAEDGVILIAPDEYRKAKEAAARKAARKAKAAA